MAYKRSAQRLLIAFGVLCLLIATALVIAPPFIVRHVLQHTLQAEGIHAHIRHIDADVFTGQISLDHIRGHGAKDRAFRIKHLAVDIDYWPLTKHRVHVSSATLSDAYIQVGRDRDQQVTILGIPLPSSPSASNQTDWDFGIDQISVSGLTVHYTTPEQEGQPAVDQHFLFDRLQLGRVATWQPDQPTPVQLQLKLKPGTLSLDGQLKPLGTPLSGHLHLKADNWPMGVLLPFVGRGHITTLAGRLNANQKIDFKYDATQGLDLALDGHGRWQNAYFSATDGTDIKATKLTWHGHETARFPWASDKPSRVSVNGQVQLGDVTADRAGQLTFRQHSARWKGKAQAVLKQNRSQVATQGSLVTQHTRLSSPGWLRLSSDSSRLTGDLDLTLTANQTRIDTNGSLRADRLSFTIPDTTSLDSQSINWQGKSATRLTGQGTHIQTDGKLTGTSLAFSVPDTTDIGADHVQWQGTMRLANAQLFSRAANGHLVANDVHVNILNAPVRLSAERFGFNGQYGWQPDHDGKSLRLSMRGSAYSHKLEVIDTDIDSPWFAALQAHADGLDINGLNTIDFKALTANGVRILGDTDTNNAVVQAVSMHAKKFSLSDLAHYAVQKLTFGDTIIHVLHDAQGWGAISDFLGQANGDDNASKVATSDRTGTPSTTYAIDHLHLSGPAVTFFDNTTSPTVKINGSELDFTLDDLNTADPKQSTSYRLSADVGAYGHFDSLGTIVPFAPDGLRMDIKAWLRSLALAPLSGYLNAAMERQIANGAADGTLNLTATKGQIDGLLDTSLTNFRLTGNTGKEATIAFGISMKTALKLIRGRNDIIHFRTKILGDLTTPYFSMDNLIREAILAGLHTALLSNYSPIGLLDRAKNAVLNLFRSVEDRPAVFTDGRHYIRPQDRRYLALIAQAMRKHPNWTLHITGQATPADAKALKLTKLPTAIRRKKLKQLAQQRQEAVRDYMAARNVIPGRIIAGKPEVNESSSAEPSVAFSLNKK